MSQKLTDTQMHPSAIPNAVAGKTSKVAPPSVNGAAAASVYASAAPDGFIGWHPGADVPMVSTAAVQQPVNTASL